MAWRRRGITGAVGVVLALVAVGCGSAKPSADPAGTTFGTMIGTAPDTRGTTSVDPGWPTPAVAALGIEVDPACPVPWAPVYVTSTHYPQAATSTGKRPEPSDPPVKMLDATDDPKIDLTARGFSGPSAPSDNSGYITVGLGAATTILGGAGQVVFWPGGRTWIGDLDGDGHDEIAVAATPGPDSSGNEPLVVVPGTVGAGSQDPRVAGIRLPVESGLVSTVIGVGDVNGDGADDVAMASGIQLVVVSGRDLMAPGPGGRLAQLPAPLAVVPADSLGWLSLTPGTTPVVGHLGGGTLDLLTDPTISLKLADPVPAGATPKVSAYLSAGHRIVVLTTDTGRDGLTEQQMWDLDTPCSAR